jgi:hypothetical protein
MFMFGLLFNIFIFALKVGSVILFIDLAFFNLTHKISYDDIEHFATTIGWNILRTYSKIHIFSNNYIVTPFKHHLTPLIQYVNRNFVHATEKDIIIFVKDGNEILKYKNKNLISSKDIKEYDFILFCPLNENILILDNINNIPDTDVQPDDPTLHTTCGFMCCQITITLKNENIIKKTFELEDFCVNSNKILDENFVKWYCKKHFPNDFDISDMKTYKINMIDNDVNEVLLGPDEFVVIDKSSYKVYNKKDIDHIKIEKDDNASDKDKKESSDEDIEKIVNDNLMEEPNKGELLSWKSKISYYLGTSKKD